MTERITELMTELKNECLLQKIPMFAVVADQTENGTEYKDEIVTPAFLNMQLDDDKISPLNALLSKKFRLEFIDEAEPGDAEAEIAATFYEDDNEPDV